MSIKIYVKYVKNNRDFYTTKMNLPTGALDGENGNMVMDILQKLNGKGITIIMVTHDKELAQCASRIIRMQDGYIYRNC